MSAIIENTSNSEFDLQRRVQLTNEIPNYDLFKRIHNAIQDSMWKWFLGWQKIVRDLPYKVEGETGAENIEVFGKMVNGVMAEKYGPTPYLVWNAKTKQFEEKNPKYHRIEVNGALLPEFDLFMHEIYRYLGRMYPDHPDFADILTNNELNDLIRNAASFIDYDINLQFMEFICSSSEDGLDFDKKEALKVKIRNLLNHNTRRKLYGSNLGFKALASGIGYWGEIYPVLTYYPLKKVPYTFVQDSNGEIVDDQNTSYTAQYNEEDLNKVDVSQTLLGNKVRLIDFDDIMTLPSKNEKVVENFKFITYQGYESFGFDSSVDVPSVKTLPIFENAQLTDNFDQLAEKTYNSDYTISIKKRALNYNGTAEEFSDKESTSENKGTKLSETLPVKYLELYQYDSIQSYIDYIKTLEGEDLKNFLSTYQELNISGGDFKKTNTSYFKNLVIGVNAVEHVEPTKIKVLPDLFNDGYVDLPLKEITKIYAKEYETKKQYKDGILTGFTVTPIETGEVPYSVDSLVSSVNYFGIREGEENSLYKISGYKKGFMNLSFKEPVVVTRFKDGDVYGLVVKTDDKYSFVQGKFIKPDEYSATSFRFEISVIPETIPEKVAEFLNLQDLTNYPLYKDSVINGVETEVANLAVGSNVEIFYLGLQQEDVDWLKDQVVNQALVEAVDFGSVCLFPIYENGAFVTESWDEYTSEILKKKIETLVVDNKETSVLYYDISETLEEKTPKDSCLSSYNSYLVAKVKELATNFYWQLEETYDEVFNTTLSKSDEYPGKTIASVSKDDENRVKNLTLGSIVLSNYLPANTYIEKVTENSELILSQAPYSTGTFMIRVLNKFPVTHEDLSNDFNDTQRLVNKDVKVSSSVFEHGLYGSEGYPYVSQIKPKAILDASLYKPYTQTFNEVVSYLYRTNDEQTELVYKSGKKAYKSLTQPSAMVNQKDVFLEIIADKLVTKATATGKTPNLMITDILDYLSESVQETVQACETPNVGVQLSMQTDTSGYYTFSEKDIYTDPKTHVRFQTFKWDNGTIPAYVKLGNNGDANQSLFIKPGEKLAEDVYGTALYNKGLDEKELKEFEKAGNRVNNLSMYGFKQLEDDTAKKDLGSTLMKLDLGEHNIILNYLKDSEYTTIVQFSILKKNINKKIKVDQETFKVSQKEYLNPEKVFSNTKTALSLNYLGLVSSAEDISELKVIKDEFNYWLCNSGFAVNLGGQDFILSYGDFLVCWNGTWMKFKNSLGAVLTKNLFSVNVVSDTEINRAVLDFWIDNNDSADLAAKFASGELNLSTFYWVHNVEDVKVQTNSAYESEVTLFWYNVKDSRVEYFSVSPNLITDNILFEQPPFMSSIQYSILTRTDRNTPMLRIEQQECFVPIDNTLVKDSLEVNFKFQIPYLSEGYVAELDDKGNFTVSETKSYFNIASNDFKYDDITDNFYIKSNGYIIDGNNIIENPSLKNKWFQIQFQTPKYFKHLNTVCGVLKTETAINVDLSSKNSTYLEGVPGVGFDLSSVSSEDKILSVQRVDLRTPYTDSLESKAFNNFVHFQLPVRSFDEANKNLILGPLYNEDYQLEKGTSLGLINSIFKSTNNGLTEDYKAYLRKIKVGKPLEISEELNADFKYFKNNLVFTAMISKEDPSKLIADSPETFQEVLVKASSGDTLEGILSESPLKSDYTLISAVTPEGQGLTIDKLAVLSNLVLLISDNQIYYNTDRTVASGAMTFEQVPTPLGSDSYTFNDLSNVSVQSTSTEVYLADGDTAYVFKLENGALGAGEFILTESADFDSTFTSDKPMIDTSDLENPDPVLIKTVGEQVFILKGSSISFKSSSTSPWWLSKLPKNQDFTESLLTGDVQTLQNFVTNSYVAITKTRLTNIKNKYDALSQSGFLATTDKTAINKFLSFLGSSNFTKYLNYKTFTSSVKNSSITLPFTISFDPQALKVVVKTTTAETRTGDALDLYYGFLADVLRVCLEYQVNNFKTVQKTALNSSGSILRLEQSNGKILTLDLNNINSERSDTESETTENPDIWEYVAESPKLIDAATGSEIDTLVDFDITTCGTNYDLVDIDGVELRIAHIEDQKPYEVLGCATQDSVKVLYGYSYSSTEIEEMLTAKGLGLVTPISELKGNYYASKDTKLPFIMVSTESESEYKVLDLRKVIPSNLLGLDLRISNVMADEGYFKAYLAVDNNVLDGFLQASFSNPKVWTWVENNNEYNSFYGSEAGAKEIFGHISDNKTLLASADVGFSTVSETLHIVSLGSDYVRFSKPLVSVELPEDLKVLVALNTNRDIPDPFVCLSEFDTAYFSNPKFEKLLLTQVDDATRANRFYSLRYASSSVEAGLGYPTVEEDTEYKLYKYNTIKVYDEETQITSEVQEPQEFLNHWGNPLYLCDSNGMYLDSTSSVSLASATLVTSDLESLAKVAYEPLYKTPSKIKKAKIMIADDILTSTFQAANLQTLKFDRSFSTISLTSQSALDLDAYGMTQDNLQELKNNINSSGALDISVDDLSIKDGKIYSKEGLMLDNLFLDFYIEASADSNNLGEEFEKIVITPTKNKINQTWSSVHLKPQGYGGRLGKQSDDLELPWETDPEAFETTELQNDLGLPILLADEKGVPLQLPSGYKEAQIKKDQTLSFSEKPFNDGLNTIFVKSGDIELLKHQAYKFILDFQFKVDFESQFLFTDDKGILSDVSEKNGLIKFKLDLNGCATSKSIKDIECLKDKYYYQIKLNDNVLTEGKHYTLDDDGKDKSLKLIDILSNLNSIEDLDSKIKLTLELTDGAHSVSKDISLKCIKVADDFPLKESLGSFSDIVGYSYYKASDLLEVVLEDTEEIEFSTSEKFTYYTDQGKNHYKINGRKFRVELVSFGLSFDLEYLKDSELLEDKVHVYLRDNDKSSVILVYNKAPLDYYKTPSIEALGWKARVTGASDEPQETVTQTVSEYSNGIVSFPDITSEDWEEFKVNISNFPEEDSDTLSFIFKLDSKSQDFELETTTDFLVDAENSNLGSYLDSEDYSKVNFNLTALTETYRDLKLYGFGGIVALRTPKYPTYKSLRSALGDTISGKVYESLDLTNTSLVSLDSSAGRIYLQSSELQNSCYYEITLLPKRTVNLTLDKTNNKKYLYELSSLELQEFTPDRVYYPENLMSPLVVNGKYHNNNIDLFSREYYKNDNGFYVYICNESGELLEAKESGDSYELSVLDPTNPMSKKLRSFKPKNLSLKDFFKEDFFLESSPSNPFYIICKGNFNTQDQDLDLKVYEPCRMGSTMGLKLLDKELLVNKGTVTKNSISTSSFTDFEKGNIVMILQYQTPSREGVKYGISYIKPTQIEDPSKFNSNLESLVGGEVSLNYSLYSFKNYNMPDTQENTGVIEINELGIFNKNDEMIAYATFPPIEYRSETQHVSFNCFIRQGSNN